MNKKDSDTQTEAPALYKLTVEATGYYFVDRGEAAPDRAPALVGLHGYGQTGPDFLRIMRQYAPARFVAAAGQGFNQIANFGGRGIMFSWLTSYEKWDSIDRNHRYLLDLLDRLSEEHAVDPRAVFLLGFSQGSSVAYRFARRHPDRVRGIISACSDLPPDVEADLTPLLRVPVLILQGLQDTMVGPEKSRLAHEALRKAGVPVEILSFDRGHVLPSSLAPAIQAWMERMLAEAH